MGIISISEIIRIFRKYFFKICALSIAAGLIAGYVLSTSQTYTCTLGFKYNHSGAADGLAPDGESKLDPYEIQNPTIIQAAVKNMGLEDEMDVKGIRQNISISKIVTELDQEVSKSAALNGEKYDVNATEYEMKFTYDAGWGDEFGAKMFSNIMKEYDEFLLTKYYNKKKVNDFAKVFKDTGADYLVIAENINASLENTVAELEELAGYYPDFRSANTGYTFSELAALYQNMINIQYAKYFGNIRAGNLAKDKEMVIKSYQKKVKDLEEGMAVDSEIAENYKNAVSSFYNSYKQSGLYTQAERVQSNVDSSNNRDQDVLEDSDLEDYKNTYDDIILNYTEHATSATDAKHSIDYYNNIIASYINDTVSPENKKILEAENVKIMKEIKTLSAEYARIANESIDEVFHGEINDDLQYLILPEVSADKPVKFIAAFLMIIVFGLAFIGLIIFEILKKYVDGEEVMDALADDEDEKKVIDTSEMDEMHKEFYEQYLNDFEEFYLVYQNMVSDIEGADEHTEIFIRWQSPTLGAVSPGKIIACASDFGLFRELNDWIIGSAARRLAEIKKEKAKLPVMHINCPYEQIRDLALNDILLKHIKENKIPAKNICLELSGKDIGGCLEDIVLLNEMGILICIDKFENSEEDMAIISVVKPQLIKMSLDMINSDMYATSDEDVVEATMNMIGYFSEIVDKCHKNGIKTCVCGVEKRSQHRIVSKIGFDYKQGYFYGKPEKADE